MVLILTDCAYMRRGLKYIASRLPEYSNPRGGHIVLFDAGTESPEKYLAVNKETDRVLLFISGEKKLASRLLSEIKNVSKISVRADIESIISRCSTAVHDFILYDRGQYPVKTSHRSRRNKNKFKMFYFYSLGYTPRMIAEVMNVSEKTIYGWSSEMAKELKLRNLTQLRYYSTRIR